MSDNSVAGAPVGRGNPAPETPRVHPKFAWMDQWLPCKGKPLDVFFPDEEPLTVRRGAEAIMICESCPARLDCLEFALRNGEWHGIWGGLTPAHRHRRGERVLAMLKRERDGDGPGA